MNPPGEDDAFPDEIESAVYNVQYSVIDGVRVRLPKSRDPGARGSVNHYLDCVRLEKKGDDAYGICTLAGCDASFKLSGPNDAPGKVKYSSFITHLKSAHPEELTQDDLEKNAPSVKRRKATDSNDQLANSARSIPAVENKKELTQHLTKLCSNGPFSWNIVNNAAFSEFLIALRVIKAPNSLPSRATVARNFKSNYKDEVLLPLEKLIKASQEVRTVTINTHTFSFRPKVHISVDGWKSPSGDCYLPVAVAGMEQKFYFVGHGKGSPNGTVKIWQPYSQIVAFSKFNPERQNAESYSKGIKEMLSQVNLDLSSDVFSATTDTTNVMPAIFRLECNKHVKWIGCCQHIGDLVAEDVYKNPVFKGAYDACHAAVVFFAGSTKRASILQASQTKLGLRPLKVLEPVVTRFLTRLIEMKRIWELRNAIDAISTVDTQNLPSDDTRLLSEIKYNLSRVIENIEGIITLFDPILKFSPSFGAERTYTFSLKREFLNRVENNVHHYTSVERSRDMKTVAVSLLQSLLKRMERIDESSTLHYSNHAERLEAEDLEEAAQMLDPATSFQWLNSTADLKRVFSGLLAALFSTHIREESPVEDNNAYDELRQKIVALENNTDNMGLHPTANQQVRDFMRARRIAEHQAAMDRLMSSYSPSTAEDSIRDALTTEVEVYIQLIASEGETWQRTIGDICAQAPSERNDLSPSCLFRYAHWPKFSNRFPLLATAAFIILSMMSANTITERANSAARHVVGRLRTSLTAENLEMLVVAYNSSKRKNGNSYISDDVQLESLQNSGRIRRDNSGNLVEDENYDPIFDLDDVDEE